MREGFIFLAVMMSGAALLVGVIVRSARRYWAETDAENLMCRDNARELAVVFRMRGHLMGSRVRKEVGLWLAEHAIKEHK